MMLLLLLLLLCKFRSSGVSGPLLHQRQLEGGEDKSYNMEQVTRSGFTEVKVKREEHETGLITYVLEIMYVIK